MRQLFHERISNVKKCLRVMRESFTFKFDGLCRKEPSKEIFNIEHDGWYPQGPNK